MSYADYLGTSFACDFAYPGKCSLYIGSINEKSKAGNTSIFIKKYDYVPPYVVILKLEDYEEWLGKLQIGDIIRLDEESRDIVGNFRILKREFIYTEDEVCIKLTLGNILRQLGITSVAGLSLTGDIGSIGRTLERSLRFPLGSVAVESISYEDNAQSGTSEPAPVTCYFPILPHFRLYKVFLSYYNKPPRTWNTMSSNYTKTEHSYTTTDISIYTNDGSSWTDRTESIESKLGRALKSAVNEYETEIELTDFYSGSGMKGLRIVTNGNSRHQLSLNIIGHLIY